MADVIIRQFEEYLREQNREMSQKLKRLETQIKEIDIKLSNLSDILADGVERCQRNIVLEKMESLEDEKTELKEYVLQEKSALDLEIPKKEELKQYFLKAQTCFRDKSLEEMQELIDMYVEKIIVYEDENEVILNLVPLFYRKDFTRQVYKISRKKLMQK